MLKYLSFILLFIIPISCERSEIFFKINGQPFYETDISAYLDGAAFQSLSRTEKEQKLNSLSSDFILLDEAKILGLDTLESVRFAIREKVQNRLLDSLLRQQVVRPLFSDSSLRKAYVHLQKSVGLNHLIINHRFSKGKSVDRTKLQARKRAEKVRELIKSDSISFERAVYRYCDDPILKDEKGRLGYIYYGRMVPEVIQIAWDPDSPRFPPIIESDFGFHIIEILGSKQVPQEPFGDLKHEIHKMTSMKTLPEGDLYFNRLEKFLTKKYQFKLLHDNIDSLYKLVKPGKENPTFGLVMNSKFSEPVATVGNEKITLSWLRPRVLSNQNLKETVCYISYSLIQSIEDALFRELGNRFAKEEGIIAQNELVQFEKKVELPILKSELYFHFLKQDKGITEEILKNKFVFNHTVWINPAILN